MKKISQKFFASNLCPIKTILVLITTFVSVNFSQTIPPPPPPPPSPSITTAQSPPFVINLDSISKKDTASFATYSARIKLLADSIAATQKAVLLANERVEGMIAPLDPKGEFEKQAEYNQKKSAYDKQKKELLDKETKNLNDKISQFEAAKKKVENNQKLLYASIDVQTEPSAAAIRIGLDEIGASPAAYSLLVPDEIIRISIQKPDYEQFDTAFTPSAGQKIMLKIKLTEKSMFSKEDEIDFHKLLAQDTTTNGYKNRIERVFARGKQVDEESKQLLADFPNTYPALEQKKEGETDKDFEKRQKEWQENGEKQVLNIQNKYKKYVEKLSKSYEVLQDYIIAEESKIITKINTSAGITLGAYDAEKEAFDVSIQDTASITNPFMFSGKVDISLDTAKVMNRSTEGFIVGLQYLNYPFVFADTLSTGSITQPQSNNINLAMKALTLSRKGVNLKIDGAFSEIEKYKSINGYGAWKNHADSLRNGTLKPKGLNLQYALADEAVSDAVNISYTTVKESKSGLGWKSWTRIITYTLAAGCAGAAVFKHIKAKDYEDKINTLKSNPPKEQSGYGVWASQYAQDVDEMKKVEKHRNIFGIAAGVLAVGGTITFFF